MFIIINRSTGQPVCEVWSLKDTLKFNPEKVEVVATLAWLQRYNRLVKLAGGVQPSGIHKQSDTMRKL